MQMNDSSNDSLIDLERQLRARMNPVQPDRQFVGALLQRLERSPMTPQRQRTAATLLSIAGGLVVGLAIFLIGRRFVENSD